MIANKYSWYTAYTLPHFEKKVRDELCRRNVETYLPLQKVLRRWSDRIKKMQVPLFPNYIFIRLADPKRQEILAIKGILKFICFEDYPAIIADDEITLIKKLEKEELEVVPNLIEGTHVKIVRGPFAGLTGRLYNKNGRNRFVIPLDAMRQSLSLEVAATNLEKILSPSDKF